MSATRPRTRSAHQFLSAAKARERARLGARSSRLDEGLRARSPGTASSLGRPHEPTPRLPLLRRDRPSIRCSRSARRRSRTRCSPRPSSASRSRRYPARPRVLPGLLARPDHRDGAARELFRDYLYFSSFSDTMLAHAREARDAPRRRARPRRRQPRRRGRQQRRLPAAVLPRARRAGARHRAGAEHRPGRARSAASRRSPSSSTPSLAARLVAEGRRADVFHANNVLAHVADLNGFVAGIAIVLADDGVAVIEVPYVKDMIDRCEFDTIYHEHLCYFSLTALDALFRRHGLAVVGRRADSRSTAARCASSSAAPRQLGACRERRPRSCCRGGRLGRHRPGAVRSRFARRVDRARDRAASRCSTG